MNIKSRSLLLTLVAITVSLILIGCTTRFLNTVFRTEQAATHEAYTSYQAWTNYLNMQSVNPEIVGNSNKLARFLAQSNEVKQARLKFAETVWTVEQLRNQVATNSSAKPDLLKALEALSDQSTNIVFTINLYRNTKL